MSIVNYKPTTPGSRGRIVTKFDYLYKGKSHKPLLTNKKNHSGRNNRGVITTRHKGGRKVLYRKVDFNYTKKNIWGVVERIEYDPNRTAHIALVKYEDGDRKYLIAQEELREGHKIYNGATDIIKQGISMQLKDIPMGTIISCLELIPGGGVKVARGAGSFCRLVAKDAGYATIKMKSGEVRKFKLECIATIGPVSNTEHALKSLGKAGAKRWLGIRPTVRGVAMNPIDHPHGGGEGRTSGGRHPVSPWGKPTKGYKTRNKKKIGSSRMIVSYIN